MGSRLARVGGSHDLLTSVSDRVVSLVLWDLDPATVLSSKDIVSTVALIVDVLGSHEGANSAVVIVLLEAITLWVCIVIMVEQVEGSATVVLAARIEVLFLDLDDCLLLRFSAFHVFKSVDLSVEAFFTEVRPSVLHMLELLGSNFLVCDGEVLIKSLLLYTQEIYLKYVSEFEY